MRTDELKTEEQMACLVVIELASQNSPLQGLLGKERRHAP